MLAQTVLEGIAHQVSFRLCDRCAYALGQSGTTTAANFNRQIAFLVKQVTDTNITRIDLTHATTNGFASGSVFSLYKVT